MTKEEMIKKIKEKEERYRKIREVDFKMLKTAITNEDREYWEHELQCDNRCWYFIRSIMADLGIIRNDEI